MYLSVGLINVTYLSEVPALQGYLVVTVHR